MSKVNFALEAKSRECMGKGSSRRLRKLENLVPAIVYGNDKDPKTITVPHNEILKAIKHEAFFSSILSLKIDGKAEKVLLKDIQRHPYKKIVMHMDFLRVSDTVPVTMFVPLHFLNGESAAGVKMGGALSQQMSEVEIKCLAKDLPEYIEVDLIDLELDKVLHVSDINLPKNVEALSPSSNPIASIHKKKGGGSDEEESSAAEGESTT